MEKVKTQKKFQSKTKYKREREIENINTGFMCAGKGYVGGVYVCGVCEETNINYNYRYV